MIYRADASRRITDGLVGARLAAALVLGSLATACSSDIPETSDLERARLALHSGNGLGAETILRQAIADGAASRAQVAALMGEAELAQGDLAEARLWLAPAEFDKASRAQGYHMLGRLEMAEGNLSAAGAALDRALVEGGDKAELWVDIGRLRYRGGEQFQALEAAEKALEVDPGSAAALQFKGQLVRDAHGSVAALPWFEAGLKLAPGDASLLADYTGTLGDSGNGGEMLRSVRRLARSHPDDKRVLYLQAVLAARGAQMDLAHSLLQRSGDAQRSNPSAMLLSAVADMENGNLASASQALERLLERQPDNRLVELLFARSLALGRNESELVYRFGEKARRLSASPYLVTLVGRAYEALGQRDKAAWYLDRAAMPRSTALQAFQPPEHLVLDGANEEDPFAKTRALIFAEQFEQASMQAERVTKRFPGSSDALGLAGDALLAAGNPDAALERYRSAASIRRNWSLTQRMAKAEAARGRAAEVQRILASYLGQDPGNAEASTMLADRLAARDDWRRVAALTDHALEHGASRDAHLLGLRARAAAAIGERSRAWTIASQAYAMQPMSPSVTQLLASLTGENDGDGAAREVLLAKARKLAARPGP